MKKYSVIILIIIILTLISFAYYYKLSKTSIEGNNTIQPTIIIEKEVEIQVTKAPTPTLAPINETIIKKFDKKILVRSKDGNEIYIPNDPTNVKFYKVIDGRNIEVPFEQVKEGQTGMLKITEIGKKAEFIFD